MANEAETAIYNRLHGAPLFHPANTELFSKDWALEPGDVVTVKSGTTEYQMPIFSMEFEWNAGNESMMHIESTGKQKRDPLPELQRRQYGAEYAAYQGKKNADTIYLNGQVIVQPGQITGEAALWSPEINCNYFYVGLSGGSGEFGCETEAHFYDWLFAEGGLFVGDPGDVGMSISAAGYLEGPGASLGSLSVDDNGTMRTATWQTASIITGLSTQVQNPRYVYTESTSSRPSDIAANLASALPNTTSIYYLGR